MVITNNDKAMKIILIILCVIVLGFLIHYEYLKKRYDKAIILLNYELKLNEAIKTYDELIKKDFTKYFTNLKVVFDCITNLSNFNTQNVLEIIEKHDKKFRGNINVLFMRYGFIFLSYVYSDQKNKAKKAYKDVLKMKGIKIKGQKFVAVFNFDFLKALNYYIENDFKKALQTINLIDTSYMNNRELLEFHYFKYLIYKKLKLEDKESLKYIKENNNDFKYLERLGYESKL